MVNTLRKKIISVIAWILILQKSDTNSRNFNFGLNLSHGLNMVGSKLVFNFLRFRPAPNLNQFLADLSCCSNSLNSDTGQPSDHNIVFVIPTRLINNASILPPKKVVMIRSVLFLNLESSNLEDLSLHIFG